MLILDFTAQKSKKTKACPTAHPSISHIRECPPGGGGVKCDLHEVMIDLLLGANSGSSERNGRARKIASYLDTIYALIIKLKNSIIMYY